MIMSVDTSEDAELSTKTFDVQIDVQTVQTVETVETVETDNKYTEKD